PMAAHALVKLHVVLAGMHENELETFIQMQSLPGSPAYGHYLTPQEFGAYFGASPAAYAHAIGMLRASGFTIVDVANNRRDIVVQAPAPVVSAFFQTPLDVHLDGARSFYAARYAPVIPAELHAEIVTGLDNYHVLHSHMHVRPHAYAGGGFSWGPADLAVGYDLNPLYAAGLTGKGITVANATSGAATASDLIGFEKQFKLPAVKFVSVPIDGPLTPAGNGESTLDVDSATAVGRNITFEQVVAHTTANNDFDDVYKYIVDTLGSSVHVVTTSWGSCEQSQSASEQALDNTYFKQAVTEGQWWFAAAGDGGTDDCADGTKALSVDFPGSSPYVVSVGGSNVHGTISNNNVTGWKSESVWSYGNCQYYGAGSNGAGGGGKSISYTKPSYQTALTPHDGRRDVPDVSLIADDVNDGVFVYQSPYGIQPGNGGTSEAAPQWAGLFAMIEQKKGNYKSVVDPHVRLYQMGAPSTRAKYFHDVVGASNGVPTCAKSAGLDPYGVFAGYNAVTGYDLASGIGSYIGYPLVEGY
ncbi:MAG: S8/S53 family peptidase, partial [Candidatus Eremiobacteraeota bacterium]|nr:S8/S53 family peptidase [Candidatus Eremiobacteraeota bacterium]